MFIFDLFQLLELEFQLINFGSMVRSLIILGHAFHFGLGVLDDFYFSSEILQLLTLDLGLFDFLAQFCFYFLDVDTVLIDDFVLHLFLDLNNLLGFLELLVKMFILGIDCVESGFVSYEWLLAEVTAASHVATSVSWSFQLLFSSHFLFELQPLGFKFHYFLTVLLLFYFQLSLSVLNYLLEVINLTFILLKLFS